ncbi:unnamed protein product [Angiostrongylus costaricensis]|uniref:Reverse transcriptase domain-containing protein n=1 Tax=Angiostrongylus costaricensis TaxID=334426 RepID=A0A0R3PL25_ANGCS|nr:unnamed protein product [Angiostrongylus costaricensis]
MRKLEWDNMGVKMDGRQLHHLRFTDDIALITPNLSEAERMLADFDKACGKTGLPCTNSHKSDVYKEWISFVFGMPHSRSTKRISPNAPSYIYLGREINVMSDLAPELSRRKRADWGNTSLPLHWSERIASARCAPILEF